MRDGSREACPANERRGALLRDLRETGRGSGAAPRHCPGSRPYTGLNAHREHSGQLVSETEGHARIRIAGSAVGSASSAVMWVRRDEAQFRSRSPKSISYSRRRRLLLTASPSATSPSFRKYVVGLLARHDPPFEISLRIAAQVPSWKSQLLVDTRCAARVGLDVRGELSDSASGRRRCAWPRPGRTTDVRRTDGARRCDTRAQADSAW